MFRSQTTTSTPALPARAISSTTDEIGPVNGERGSSASTRSGLTRRTTRPLPPASRYHDTWVVRVSQSSRTAAKPSPEPGRPLDGRPRRSTDQQRNGAAHGFRTDLRARDPVIPAAVLDGIWPPAGPHRREVVLETGATPRHRHGHGIELLGHPALPDPGHEATAREAIQRGHPFGEDEGRLEQRVHDQRPQADPSGVRRDPGERLQRVEHPAVVVGQPVWVGAVRCLGQEQPFERPDAVETEAFGRRCNRDDAFRAGVRPEIRDADTDARHSGRRVIAHSEATSPISARPDSPIAGRGGFTLECLAERVQEIA